MGQILKIRELDRDDELGAVKKIISSRNGNFSFETPIVSQRRSTVSNTVQPLRINEIPRQIDDRVVSELEERGITPFAYEVKQERLEDRLNLTIFNFRFDSVPTNKTIRLLAHALHASSKDVMFLPAVKTSFLQETIPNRKTPIYSIKKVHDYLEMMKTIIYESKFRNGHELIGTIPLIPPKFVRPIIEFYLSEGIEAFAIDANFKDIILNEGDFRLILSEINIGKPLNETLIFACNVGIPQYEQHAIRSDDFLSIFAYVDVLGLTFKKRGGGVGVPRAKVFSREKYAYDVYSYPDASRVVGRPLNYSSLKYLNRIEQLKETQKVQHLLGDKKIKEYLQTKNAVDHASMKKLESIANNIKVV